MGSNYKSNFEKLNLLLCRLEVFSDSNLIDRDCQHSHSTGKASQENLLRELHCYFIFQFYCFEALAASYIHRSHYLLLTHCFPEGLCSICKDYFLVIICSHTAILFLLLSFRGLTITTFAFQSYYLLVSLNSCFVNRFCLLRVNLGGVRHCYVLRLTKPIPPMTLHDTLS